MLKVQIKNNQKAIFQVSSKSNTKETKESDSKQNKTLSTSNRRAQGRPKRKSSDNLEELINNLLEEKTISSKPGAAKSKKS